MLSQFKLILVLQIYFYYYVTNEKRLRYLLYMSRRISMESRYLWIHWDIGAHFNDSFQNFFNNLIFHWIFISNSTHFTSHQKYYLLSGCSCMSLLVISVSAMTWHLNGDASRQNVKALNCLIAYAFASQKCNVFFLSCLFSSFHFLLLNWTCLCACEILYNILV